MTVIDFPAITRNPTTLGSARGLSVSMDPIIDDYVDWMQARGLRENTIAQRAHFADSRLRDWGTWDVPGADIAGWLAGFGGWTALTYHGHLVSLYRWLTATGQIEDSPVAGLRRPPKPRANPRPLSPAQVETVLAGVTGDLRAWMLLALFAGLRAYEIAKFRGSEIDSRSICIDGKGGQRATVPTHPDLWELAQDYPARGLWFPSPVREGQSIRPALVSAKVARRFRAVGIESGSIHRLRATYGTQLMREGANLRIVQKLMRHESLATTEHYLGVDEDECSAAIRKLAA